jgi:hypothetical protein
MTPRAQEALLEQRKAFIEKFGREPGPCDPVFFDPDKDVPTPIDPAQFDADLDTAIRDAGIDPVKADAIRKLLYWGEAQHKVSPRSCLRPVPQTGDIAALVS